MKQVNFRAIDGNYNKIVCNTTGFGAELDFSNVNQKLMKCKFNSQFSIIIDDYRNGYACFYMSRAISDDDFAILKLAIKSFGYKPGSSFEFVE